MKNKPKHILDAATPPREGYSVHAVLECWRIAGGVTSRIELMRHYIGRFAETGEEAKSKFHNLRNYEALLSINVQLAKALKECMKDSANAAGRRLISGTRYREAVAALAAAHKVQP